MLWKKLRSGIYVNLCREDLELKTFEKANSLLDIEIQLTKSNDRSLKYRKLGNLQFATEQWLQAIESYNISLCFAEIGTEYASLAYGNRSACFLHLEMYDKCIVDIELAVDGSFPARLLPKLEKRKAHCLERIRNGGVRSHAFERKLSFQENPNYPGMSNVLKIEVCEKYGRHILATSDIDVGKIVITEKAFVTKSHGKYNRCDGCWKTNVNLVPCPRCTSALLCPGQCEGSQFHKIQCEIRVVDDENINDMQSQLIRSLLMAIFEFPSVDDLIKFVEEVLASDPMEVPESLLDTKSKYRAFLKLAFDRKTAVKETFPTQICFVYKTFLNHQDIGSKFSKNKHRRFLMHLIGHHICVVQCNTGALSYSPVSPYNVSQAMRENLSIVVNYINHSCLPNLCLISSEDFNLCIALRPIKAGDQLFLSYFRNDSLKQKHSTVERQKFLRDICGFDCDCYKCLTSTRPASVLQQLTDELKADVQYDNVRKFYNDMNSCKLFGLNVLTLCSCREAMSCDAKTMMQESIALMEKYRQIKCSAELDFVVECLETALKVQFER